MFLRKLFQPKKVTSKYPNMSFIHRDSEGLDWYQYNDNTTMPLRRYLKLQKFIMVWNRNLTNEELNELISIAEGALEDGVQKVSSGKRMNFLKVASVLNEIKNRQEKIRTIEVMADIIASSLVRSDEVYDNYDKAIHLSKKQYLLDEAKKKEPFFIQTAIFKMLSKSAVGSSEDFNQYLEEQAIQAEVNQRRTEYLSSLG